MGLLKPVLHAFEQLRDNFIAEDVIRTQDIDMLYRFRLVSGISLIIVILVSLFVITFPVISHFSWPGSMVSTSLCLILVAGNIYILRNLKQQKNIDRPAQQLIFSVWFVIVLGVMSTGGVLDNNIPAFLQTPVIMAFLILGRKAGIIYALSSMAIYWSFTQFELHFWDFPSTISPEHAQSIELMLWLYFAGCILALALAYDDLTRKLMIARKEEQDKQTYLATHDSLTGLANRKKFDDYLDEAIHRTDRNRSQVALMIIDLNDFKPVNDNYGHDLGDQILIHVADQISSTVRADDLAARIGGDEFAVVIQGDINQCKLEQMVARLLESISQPLASDANIKVSGSIGISRYPEQASSEDELRKHADLAMYKAKNNPRQWCDYSELKSGA